jgi:hypothetical protein
VFGRVVGCKWEEVNRRRMRQANELMAAETQELLHRKSGNRVPGNRVSQSRPGNAFLTRVQAALFPYSNGEQAAGIPSNDLEP